MICFKKCMKIFVNLITTGRLIGSIILVTLIPFISKYIFIFSIILLFLTDLIDGFLARKFEVQTFYGSTMDTVADKVLSIVMLIPLILEIDVMILVLVGEIGIAFLNVYGRIQGKHTKSSMVGKVKMWFLAISVILGYCNIFWNNLFFCVFLSCIVTFLVQLYVIICYYFYLKGQVGSKSKNRKDKVSSYKEFIYILFSTNYYRENIMKLDNEIGVKK